MPLLSKRFSPLVFFSFLIFVLFGLDLYTKYLISEVLSPPYLFGQFLKLVFEKNTGIAFSIQMPLHLLLSINVLLIIVIIALIVLKFNFKNPLAILVAAMLLAGAAGNLRDRLLFGYVIDFISIGSFPVFNLADIYISVSVFILFLFYGKIKKE